MPEVTTYTTYALRLSEREFKTMTKALAILADLPGVKATVEDRAEAADLNERLLQVGAADLRQKLGIAEGKLEKLRPADAPVSWGDKREKA